MTKDRFYKHAMELMIYVSILPSDTKFYFPSYVCYMKMAAYKTE